MKQRYPEIDILKGIAVICMVIFHIFYYPNQYGYKEINYELFPLPIIAKIAQFIFITCVGINLVLVYSKNKENDKYEYYKKQFKRISKLIICALLMSSFTYFVFRDNFVKFGILHFIAFSSLLLMPIIDKPNIIQLLIILITVLFFLNIQYPNMFYNIPPHTAFISGFYSNWNSIDHFPLIPWLAIMCFGVLIGHIYVDKQPDLLPKELDNLKLSQFLQTIGSHSLQIYMVHWIILYIIYTFIYPKFIRNLPP